MPKFGDLASKFLKTIVRFESNTFEIGYIRNFVRIRKLILSGPKSQNLDIWDWNFWGKNVRFEIRTFQIGYRQNFVNIRKLIPFAAKSSILGIWAQNLKINANRKLQISPILKFCVAMGRVARFLACISYFWLLSGRFGSFWVIVIKWFWDRWQSNN